MRNTCAKNARHDTAEADPVAVRCVDARTRRRDHRSARVARNVSNSTRTTSTSRRIFRCACRIRSSSGCASAIRTIRCCDRCCRCRPSATPSPGYSLDPLEEASATLAPGVIQKYHGRVLLIAAPACAVHCRYCFRRTFPYADHQQAVAFPSLTAVERDREHLRSDPVRRRSADAERRSAARDSSRGSTPFHTCAASASIRACRW